MAEDADSFTVSYPETVRAGVKELAIRASDLGMLDSILAAVRAIDTRLKKDPRSFGEPKFRYQELKLVLYVAIQFPLVVHFTVHECLPVVFVKAIRALPGQGL